MIKFKSSDETKITDAFTKLLRSEIRRKGLIDTGALFRSISTSIKYTANGISFEISGEDYFKYVDGNFNVTEDALDSNEFKNKITKLIEDALINVLIDKI